MGWSRASLRHCAESQRAFASISAYMRSTHKASNAASCAHHTAKGLATSMLAASAVRTTWSARFLSRLEAWMAADVPIYVAFNSSTCDTAIPCSTAATVVGGSPTARTKDNRKFSASKV
eukprot:CAMPEP_0178374664 /NCGR_PEP_ID=MMETSP0689_2-20121128/2492_1 /TAXON_ID=160604 /ORGANISM="Amphidinium massartii, Strain CS-259" /LENGTH=118 /DNA_ID=CAMNT_0019994639 /DNA_START=1010 /DNA_END=1366 /DNA_ORIENTATION=+